MSDETNKYYGANAFIDEDNPDGVLCLYFGKVSKSLPLPAPISNFWKSRIDKRYGSNKPDLSSYGMLYVKDIDFKESTLDINYGTEENPNDSNDIQKKQLEVPWASWRKDEELNMIINIKGDLIYCPHCEDVNVFKVMSEDGRIDKMRASFYGVVYKRGRGVFSKLGGTLGQEINYFTTIELEDLNGDTTMTDIFKLPSSEGVRGHIAKYFSDKDKNIVEGTWKTYIK